MGPDSAVPDDGGVAGKFRHTYSHYAVQFGQTVRTVKRWVSLGRKAGDPPPLDHPADLPAWWTRHMKIRVPQKVWDAAGGAAMLEIPAASAPEAPAAPPPELPLSDAGPDPDSIADEILAELPMIEGLGMDVTLERLRALEAHLFRRASQPGQSKPYLEVVSRLTAVIGKVRSEAEAEKRLIQRDLAETMIHEFHAPIERETRLLYGAMAKALGIPETPEGERVWNDALDQMFARFQKEVFAV